MKKICILFRPTAFTSLLIPPLLKFEFAVWKVKKISRIHL